MAQRLVAADASPLIGLAAAGGFNLLRRLYGAVVVTAAVRDEVIAGGELPGATELAAAIEDGWVIVASAPAGLAALPDLGAGEASTLLLAQEYGGECLVLMDDPVGRSHARERGIPVTGVVGVLLAAKRARLVKRVRPYLDRLAASDFRLSGELVRAVLEAAGEAGPSRR